VASNHLSLETFVGPAILVSVGYMDPGNWGTDLQAGARFKYGLLWVVALASLMSILMQVISARLGVVTGNNAVVTGIQSGAVGPIG
jgi:manganese transport protein